MTSRLLAVLAAVALLAGCTGGAVVGPAGGSGAATAGGAGGAALAEGTCWTGDLLGADPRRTLRLSRQYDVPYRVAAQAVATWPAFSHGVSCSAAHAVEVFSVIRLPALEARLADYGVLLRGGSGLAGTVARSVEHGCMTGPLLRAAALAVLRGAVMAPALPAGATLGWAPATPERWRRGERVFACTLTWKDPQRLRYAQVFTNALPTALRTCIDSRALLFVDCARGHDRERIAVIDARQAVEAGAFPGPRAVREGVHGRYLDVSDAAWAGLDAACTAYLRAVSTTNRLTGVANVDVDRWPTPDGSYPIYCDADRRPDQQSLVTQGSVYDRS